LHPRQRPFQFHRPVGGATGKVDTGAANACRNRHDHTRPERGVEILGIGPAGTLDVDRAAEIRHGPRKGKIPTRGFVSTRRIQRQRFVGGIIVEFSGIHAQRQVAAAQGACQFERLARIVAIQHQRADAIGHRPVKGKSGGKGRFEFDAIIDRNAGQLGRAIQIGKRQVDVGTRTRVICSGSINAQAVGGKSGGQVLPGLACFGAVFRFDVCHFQCHVRLFAGVRSLGRNFEAGQALFIIDRARNATGGDLCTGDGNGQVKFGGLGGRAVLWQHQPDRKAVRHKNGHGAVTIVLKLKVRQAGRACAEFVGQGQGDTLDCQGIANGFGAGGGDFLALRLRHRLPGQPDVVRCDIGPQGLAGKRNSHRQGMTRLQHRNPPL